jgi:uncharacterized repeat protein (TIGR01451 family)
MVQMGSAKRANLAVRFVAGLLSKLIKSMRLAAVPFGAFLLSLAVAPNALAASVTLTNSDTGWYQDNGFHGAGNKNYYTGQISFSPSAELRGYITFNIPSGQNFTSATLRVFTYTVVNGPNTLSLSQVSTPVSTLQASNSGRVDIWTDLGDGASFGSQTISTSNAFVDIPLNATALAAINAAQGAGFAIGFRNLTISATDDAIFSFSNSNTGNQLILQTDSPSLSITKSHTGTFTQGATATWNIQVGNTGTGATDGSTVTVSDTLPSGYTLASFSGTGWSCSGASGPRSLAGTGS